jgi:hypothetical protein
MFGHGHGMIPNIGNIAAQSIILRVRQDVVVEKLLGLTTCGLNMAVGNKEIQHNIQEAELVLLLDVMHHKQKPERITQIRLEVGQV